MTKNEFFNQQRPYKGILQRGEVSGIEYFEDFLWEIFVNIGTMIEGRKDNHMIDNSDSYPIITNPDTIVVLYPLSFFRFRMPDKLTAI
jgi:hypothetical protein